MFSYLIKLKLLKYEIVSDPTFTDRSPTTKVIKNKSIKANILFRFKSTYFETILFSKLNITNPKYIKYVSKIKNPYLKMCLCFYSNFSFNK